MRIERLHGWDVSVKQAFEIQRDLATKIIQCDTRFSPRLVVGFDVSVNTMHEAYAAAVVLSYPEMEVLERVTARGKTNFPYIPGLLSFREMPLTLEVCEKISNVPDLAMVDGQGIAHPRKMGLASHLGLFLNIPTIGCAKSPLCGSFQDPGSASGSCTDISNAEGETIGAVLRTRTGVKPLFISVGHKIDLSAAVHWTIQCCRGYRLPEPTRLAHLACKGKV